MTAPSLSTNTANPSGEKPENQRFSFEHKLFTIKGAVFKLDADRHPALFVDLDSVKASIPLRTLRDTFGIKPGCNDDLLLDKVSSALRHVREVRPGDDVPTEVIDGRASWMVDARYIEIAKAKIGVQLIDWIGGLTVRPDNYDNILSFVETEEARTQVQKAVTQIADRLKIEDVVKVIDLIERLAGELGTIEALRDRLLRRSQAMLATLKQMIHNARGDRHTVEELQRIRHILETPVRDIQTRLETLDANIGEIMPTLRDFEVRVRYIRETRDELRGALMLWGEILDEWDEFSPSNGVVPEQLVRDTYRFAARNFLQAQSWGGRR